MHIKTGDTVQIISGSHKGKISKILKVFPKTNKLIVENINLKLKHSRPSQEEESGKIVNFEAPIHCSNVMLYSTKIKFEAALVLSMVMIIKNTAY